MSTTKHTKGNWQTALQPEMDIRIGAYIPGEGCIGLVATVDQSENIDFEQMQANAKLIAAAPELLDAAEGALTEALASFNFDIKMAPEWLQKLDAIVKKATE